MYSSQLHWRKDRGRLQLYSPRANGYLCDVAQRVLKFTVVLTALREDPKLLMKVLAVLWGSDALL